MSVEVEADKVNRRVNVRTIDGVDFGDGNSTRHIERELSLSRMEARTIASAMMGCAAEV